MKKCFREVLSLFVVAAGFGLIAWRYQTGLAVLPLVGLVLRYWFGGRHDRQTTRRAKKVRAGDDRTP